MGVYYRNGKGSYLGKYNMRKEQIDVLLPLQMQCG
jgi:hypothetical protein